MKSLRGVPLWVITVYSLAISAGQDSLKAPGVVAEWNSSVSIAAVTITISDSSTSETGYLLYRAPGNSSAFSRIAQIVSANLALENTITYYDSTVSSDSFYSYKAVAYNATDSISSAVSTVFTFHFSRPPTMAHFTKLSTYPIADSIGWSALAGDSVILKEKNAPAGKLTVINVSSPSAPASAGSMDSSTLVSYPLKTLIPIYLKFGIINNFGSGQRVFCRDNYAVIVGDSAIQLFKYADGSFTLVSSCKDTGGYSSVLPLNDSLLCVQYTVTGPDSSFTVIFPKGFLYILRISSSGSLIRDSCIEVNSPHLSIDYYLRGTELTCDVRGPCNGALLLGSITNTDMDPPMQNWVSSYSIIAYDLTASKIVQFDSLSAPTPESPSLYFPPANYSGYLLSPAQYLSSNFNTLYAADPRDSDAYTTALSQGAVLPDSSSNRPQNVLIDSINKRLYILYQSSMSIYSYAFAPLAVRNTPKTHRLLPGELRILSSAGRPGITIVFPVTARHADLTFYDLSGRIVDRLSATGSNAVLWRPKTHGTGCYVVSAKIDGESYSAKFMMK